MQAEIKVFVLFWIQLARQNSPRKVQDMVKPLYQSAGK